MKKKILIIVGYTNWGKSHTLYELVDRKHFFPLKNPITIARRPAKKFTIINASNEDRTTKKYLIRLKKVLKKHAKSDTHFVITISLIFKKNSHNVNAVLDYINSLKKYEIVYAILKNGWFRNTSINEKDLIEMESKIMNSQIEYFNQNINLSKARFIERVKEIALFI